MHHVQNHRWRGGVGCECDFLFRSRVAAQHKQRFYSSQSTCSQTATVAQVPALLAQNKITQFLEDTDWYVNMGTVES